MNRPVSGRWTYRLDEDGREIRCVAVKWAATDGRYGVTFAESMMPSAIKRALERVDR